MERTIQLVQPMKLAERKLLRVAAYARVSCDKDAMKHSLAAQISYYNEYIQRHNDWVFAGIYADEAYSGTKDDRPRFVQLIQDCKDGKIDRIITKSISRFARNTTARLVNTYFISFGYHEFVSTAFKKTTKIAAISLNRSIPL